MGDAQLATHLLEKGNTIFRNKFNTMNDIQMFNCRLRELLAFTSSRSVRSKF
jgi:hypothetical protein